MPKNRENVVVWFEIPAEDFDRAVGFYEKVLKTSLRRQTLGEYQMGIFPGEDTAAKGCVIAGEGCRPGYEGTMVYVNADGQLKAAVQRAEKAGGQVLQDVTPLPDDLGLYAVIRDTEGNRVGLHARS